MEGILLAIALTLGLSAYSLHMHHMHRYFRSIGRLPMQWSENGAVNWSAPTWIALFFTPALAAFMVGGIAVLLACLPDKPGRMQHGVGMLLFTSACFAAFHVMHLARADRSIRRQIRDQNAPKT